MKRTGFIAAVLAVLLLAVLCGCNSSPDDLAFENQTGTQLHSIYISSVDRDEWADAVNYARLSNGRKIYVDFERVDGDGPGMYDVGAVDENNLNYDFYDVALTHGDTLTLYPAQEDEGRLTVTAADGTVTEYKGYCYDGDE